MSHSAKLLQEIGVLRDKVSELSGGRLDVYLVARSKEYGVAMIVCRRCGREVESAKDGLCKDCVTAMKFVQAMKLARKKGGKNAE